MHIITEVDAEQVFPKTITNGYKNSALNSPSIPYQNPYSQLSNNFFSFFYDVYLPGEQKDELNGAMICYILRGVSGLLMSAPYVVYPQYSHKLCVWHRSDLIACIACLLLYVYAREIQYKHSRGTR